MGRVESIIHSPCYVHHQAVMVRVMILDVHSETLIHECTTTRRVDARLMAGCLLACTAIYCGKVTPFHFQFQFFCCQSLLRLCASAVRTTVQWTGLSWNRLFAYEHAMAMSTEQGGRFALAPWVCAITHGQLQLIVTLESEFIGATFTQANYQCTHTAISAIAQACLRTGCKAVNERQVRR